MHRKRRLRMCSAFVQTLYGNETNPFIGLYVVSRLPCYTTSESFPGCEPISLKPHGDYVATRHVITVEGYVPIIRLTAVATKHIGHLNVYTGNGIKRVFAKLMTSLRKVLN